ncbi:MAG: EamA family transporter [Candidatus Bathyarchaeota archaeon]|nr:EamA family transporter [Candidatus Bathyarchaeota archaeon]
MATKTSLFNTLLMLTLIIFWGSSFVVVKIALDEGLTPVAIATFRFLIAGGLFLATLLFKKNREQDYKLLVEKKDAPTLLFLALTGVTFFFTIQYTGIKMAGPSIAAIFVCLLSPIFISVLSARIFKEHLMKKQIFGIGLAVAGAFIVITGGTLSLPGDSQFFLGSLLLLSTPVLWAAYSLLGKKIMEKYNPFLVVAYVTVLGGLCLIPFSLAENSLHQLITMSLYGWLAILFLSITCSLLGYYIWFYVLKRVRAAVTSSFLFAEPLVTVLFAVMFVGEKLSLSILAGGVPIFIGVYLVTAS